MHCIKLFLNAADNVTVHRCRGLLVTLSTTGSSILHCIVHFAGISSSGDSLVILRHTHRNQRLPDGGRCQICQNGRKAVCGGQCKLAVFPISRYKYRYRHTRIRYVFVRVLVTPFGWTYANCFRIKCQ